MIPIASEDPDIPQDVTIDETMIDWNAGDARTGNSGLTVGRTDTIPPRPIVQVLPEYPPGLQREAVVKIRFWVLPDGRVGTMIPVRKGDPKLEEITMKAIRQWRFNAIPASEEQRNVEGVITFVYKLQ